MCGAKLAGVRHFKETGYTHITGCTAQPSPRSKFCSDHQTEESPALEQGKVSEASKRKLRDRRKELSYSENAGQDSVYIIQAVTDIKDDLYKIKWVGYDIETWEPSENVPKFIREFYKDPQRLKASLPNPNIKYTKQLANGCKMHFLTWEGITEKGDGMWVGEDWFQLAAEDGDLVSSVQESETCNTRKSRDKQANRRHTVGLLIGALPCGTVTMWDELHGSEGIRQVHGLVCEHVASLSEGNQLTHLGYDDQCHFCRHARMEGVKSQSTAASKLADMKMVVDKFHFKNHIGDWCVENCDPYKLPELVQVNTPVCEQLFKKINQHTNCKGMSEANYFLFWLVNLDHHNMDIEGKANILPDPRSDYRWNSFSIHPVDFTSLASKQTISTSQPTTANTRPVEPVVEVMEDKQPDPASLHNSLGKCTNQPYV